MRSKLVYRALLVILCGVVFAGCSSASDKVAEKRSSLKIMYVDEEAYFFTQYGDLFAMQFPNIDIEVISTSSIYTEDNQDYNKAFADFIEKKQPDVVMLSMDDYEKFAAEGKLLELNPLIERDKYDMRSIYPALIEILKQQGDGKLYGLAPSFYGSALFYNVDLFAKYGVKVPHDGMTWQEIIDTARQFPTAGDEKTRVYGFGNGNAMSMEDLASDIAGTQGLKVINTDTMKITLNTDSWKQAYKLAKDAVDSGTFYNPKDGGFQSGTLEDLYQSQAFLMGRSAMTIGRSYLLSNLKDAKNTIKDYKPFQVGIVAGPVDPAEPDKSRDITFNELFAIRANSLNVDAAWEFLKFVNGEQFAQIRSKSLNNGLLSLLSRTGYSKEYDGVNLGVFYKLKPILDGTSSMDNSKIPGEFHSQYQTVVERELKLVEEKQKSIEEALQAMEQEGQAVLDKTVKDEAAK
ncbi:multiple sugar transport system substrate-binding protein [Fontibacillus phaseoli]|uniref:Multiple sugar transport system substrate-binding protein n=1 Tax=Fontibacillus phaseoli TaxID=1416533 RepID=A0A369BJF4_9BACL|nr:extracellular solute-binding protein [Fontibacillus phaseoli]RCX21730.1 multiple sugar transport system substrate-binding protein [Fontibacillus phaseoli]